jgi:hypothetical protein
LYDQNSFITLTYDESTIPPGGSLWYPDFQKFMKRLRKFTKRPVRFYMGGEYGESTARPHYHACLFGYDFPDKVFFRKSSSGEKMYTSAILERLWPHGLSSVGSVSFESAAYIARYCVSKVTGDLAESHYSCPEYVDPDGVICQAVTPEFNHMSLKPGIGARWLSKFETDVFPRDYVVVNGVKTRPPKYYDALFERENPEVFSDIVAQRELDGYASFLSGEQSLSRLSVKEQVHSAQLSQLKRGFL